MKHNKHILIIGIIISLLFSFSIISYAEENVGDSKQTYVPIKDLCASTPDRFDKFTMFMDPSIYKIPIYAGQSWSAANLYRAGNGGPVAYADYYLGYQYDLLTFQALPYDDSFTPGASAVLTISNTETGEILYTSNSLTKESNPISGQIDVSNINMLRVTVTKMEGTLAYTMLKDLIVWSSNENAKAILSDSTNEYTPILNLTTEVPENSNVFSQTVASEKLTPQVYAGVSWESANLYRAGNGSNVAFAEYTLDDQYSLLTFNAMPYLANNVFTTSAIAKIDIINADTGEILFTAGGLTRESNPVEGVVDISNVKRLRISVSKEGLLAYTLIKDVILWK